MAISKLQASLAAVTNELTVAAANIKFDFTLVKCEAPKEYRALGENLSIKRKDEAETGMIHITAQRLGALFEGVCSPTPNLVKAYGTRVSEISEAVKEKFGPDHAKGTIFSAQAGIDGASIWAAATSSTTALHVQLLACMLARIWSGPEATSAWVELVKERRKEIALQLQDGDSISFASCAAAAQLEIPRSQLADWDASARSWLDTADSIKSQEQKALMLILDKITLPVNEKSQLFDSVISAWTSALRSMEMLLDGVPQATNSGSLLIALGSWFIYPVIIILGGEAVRHDFCDPLVSDGGTVTIGLENPVARDENDVGIHWCLSFAHLRYYGKPVISRKRLGHDSSRLTFDQFIKVAFGSILGTWISSEAALLPFSQFFVTLENAFESCLPTGYKSTHAEDSESETPGEPAPPTGIVKYLKNDSHWLHLLAQAANSFADVTDPDHEVSCKLVRKGVRSSARFLESPPDNWPLFGLSRYDILDRCLDGPEERINLMRWYAKREFGNETGLLIRYYSTRDPSLQHDSSQTSFATAIPYWNPRKRKYEAQDISGNLLHQRWVINGVFSYKPPKSDRDIGEEFFSRENLGELCISEHHFEISTTPGIWTRYEYVFGDVNTAAIFHPTKQNRTYKTNAVSIESLVYCLEQRLFNLPTLLITIEGHLDIDPISPISCTLKALSPLSVIYKLLPDATLAIETLSRPLHRSKWVQSMLNKRKVTELFMYERVGVRFDEELLDRKRVFSCLAYLESGVADIDPDQLANVFAMSTSNSLYVSMPLLCDPYENPRDFEVRRILGNIGRAGISMLILPHELMIRAPNPASWENIGAEDFNGRAEDTFKHTTLHLSFTDYSLPISAGSKGTRDYQVSLVESIVSVYDRGIWVGDVDILGAFQNIRRLVPQIQCKHEKNSRPARTLLSLESWDEVLDPPKASSIARASANWSARLAIVAILVQIYKHDGLDPSRSGTLLLSSLTDIIVCPRSVCWKCLDPEIRQGSNTTSSSQLRGILQYFVY